MNKFLLVLLLIIGVCIAYPHVAFRAACFLISLFLALNAYFYFEHAVLFRDKWQTATTGKRRTSPGQAIIVGLIFLVAAIALMFYSLRR